MRRVFGSHEDWQARLRRIENAFYEALLSRREPPREIPPFERVVFLCKGNICRSAFAEGYARATHPRLAFESAGLEAADGARSPELAVEAAARFGVDLDPHRARSIVGLDERVPTLFLAMEPWHRRHAVLQRASRESRVHLLGRWARPPRGILTDPYGGTRDEFLASFRLIAGAIDALLGERDSPGPPAEGR